MRTNLFVRNTAECIIGIFPFQIDDKLSELVIMAEFVDGVHYNHVRNNTLSWAGNIPKAFQPIMAEKSR